MLVYQRVSFFFCTAMFDYRRVLRPSLNPLKLAFYPTKSGMKVEKCSLKAGYDMTYQPRALGINGVSISAMRVYRWGMDSNEYCQHMPHKKKKTQKQQRDLFLLCYPCRFLMGFVVCFEYSHVQTHGLLPRIELCRCPRSVALWGVGAGQQRTFMNDRSVHEPWVSPWIKDDFYRFTLR